jgi:hypothetical protein
LYELAKAPAEGEAPELFTSRRARRGDGEPGAVLARWAQPARRESLEQLGLRESRAWLVQQAPRESLEQLGLRESRACRVRREKLATAGCLELRACQAPPERAGRSGLRDPRAQEETWDPTALQALKVSRVSREWLAQPVREESWEQLGLRVSRAWLGHQAPRESWGRLGLLVLRACRVRRERLVRERRGLEGSLAPC